MSAAEPTNFEQLAQNFDETVRAARPTLQELGICVADWSNRHQHHDPLRSIDYTFVSKQSIDGEQQKVTVSISVMEPVVEGEEMVVTLATNAERFWVGKESHWKSTHETVLTPGELRDLNLAARVREQIANGLAEIAQGNPPPQAS